MVQVFDLLFVAVARFDFTFVVEDFALVVDLGFGFTVVFGFGFAATFGVGFGLAMSEGALCLVGSWIVPFTFPPAALIFSAARWVKSGAVIVRGIEIVPAPRTFSNPCSSRLIAIGAPFVAGFPDESFFS